MAALWSATSMRMASGVMLTLSSYSGSGAGTARDLGYRPEIGFEEGLRRTVAWSPADAGTARIEAFVSDSLVQHGLRAIVEGLAPKSRCGPLSA